MQEIFLKVIVCKSISHISSIKHSFGSYEREREEEGERERKGGAKRSEGGIGNWKGSKPAVLRFGFHSKLQKKKTLEQDFQLLDPISRMHKKAKFPANNVSATSWNPCTFLCVNWCPTVQVHVWKDLELVPFLFQISLYFTSLTRYHVF